MHGIGIESLVLQITRHALLLVVVISGIPVMASMVVGVFVSVFQAATQIQEQTLTFVPTLLVCLGTIMIGIPLVFAVFLFPIMDASITDHTLIPPMGLYFTGMVVKEIFVGFCIGYVVSIPFYAVEAAGSFMDTVRGTTFAQTIAPFLG